MTAKDDAGKAMGPVEKQQWLDDAAALAHLSRAELAALIVIANTMNSKTGIAWLSMATIGRRTGTTTRTANNITKRLLGLGLVELVKRGTRQGASNHYTLNRHYFSQSAGSEAGDTTPGEVVKPSVEGSEAQRTEVVKQASPISIPESEPLAKDEGDRSQAEAGTAPLRPVGACVASRQTKRGADQFPEFWQVWPNHTDVTETEKAIAEALAEGVPLAEIIAGTERFARYCEATGTPPKLKPSTFVRGDKWRDDWELTRRAPASKAGTGKASVWVELPAWRKWDARIDKYDASLPWTGDMDNDKPCEDMLEAWCEANPAPPRWKNTATGATAADTAWDSCPTDRTPPPDDWDGVTRIDMWGKAARAKTEPAAKPQARQARNPWVKNPAWLMWVDRANEFEIGYQGRTNFDAMWDQWIADHPEPGKWRNTETGEECMTPPPT